MDDNMFNRENNREEIENEMRRIQEAINRDCQNADRREIEANMRRMEELENEIRRIVEQDDRRQEAARRQEANRQRCDNGINVDNNDLPCFDFRNVDRIWRRRDEPRIQILPIDKFEGDVSELADWLVTYETDARACDWHEEDILRKFPLHLKGFARTAYQQLRPEECDTWPHLIENFRRKLSLTDDIQSDTQRFCSRIQKPGEKVIEFAFTLRTLANRAFAGANNCLREQLLFNQFITGLRSEFRTHPIMVEVRVFDEAVQKARMLEERGLTRTIAKISKHDVQDVDDYKKSLLKINNIKLDKYSEPNNGNNSLLLLEKECNDLILAHQLQQEQRINNILRRELSKRGDDCGANDDYESGSRRNSYNEYGRGSTRDGYNEQTRDSRRSSTDELNGFMRRRDNSNDS